MRLDTPCDLLVGVSGGTHLVEVKKPMGPRGGVSDRTLTPAQEEFRARWRGSDLEVLRTVEEAKDWLKRKKKLRFSTV